MNAKVMGAAAERPIALYEENLAAYAPHPAVVGFESGRDHVVRFRAKGRELVAFDENGRIALEGGDGEWRAHVRSNHGALVAAH